MRRSVESGINEQYEKFFQSDDWTTFKYAADYYLKNAALILKKDINYCDDSLKLMFRNIQKRLYIGIACEFLLKSIFLKLGYVTNKPQSREIPEGSYPYLFSSIDPKDFSMSNTLTFNELLQKLCQIGDFENSRATIEKGLKIAKVFRNKEGHVVSVAHEYDSQNYRDVEEGLKLLYEAVFAEKIEIFIAFGKNETGKFEIGN
ncbi:MAG: hypothetical protein P1U80_09380 [Pseudomonadales bacterium]|nr:hypothetical protein [Pseudomonadales bacterium]